VLIPSIHSLLALAFIIKRTCVDFAEMAAQFFNRIGQIGLGVALVGGVVNSALYNGKDIV
jgi:hypothetical protein